MGGEKSIDEVGGMLFGEEGGFGLAGGGLAAEGGCS